MTKTIIAIGLGLLAAIFSPARAVLAEDGFVISMEEGSGDEILSIRARLSGDPSVDSCSVETHLCLTFPENPDKDAVCHPLDLSLADPSSAFQYVFDPQGRDDLREAVEVRAGAAKLIFMGTGGCLLRLSLFKYLGRSGVSTGRTELEYVTHVWEID